MILYKFVVQHNIRSTHWSVRPICALSVGDDNIAKIPPFEFIKTAAIS